MADIASTVTQDPETGLFTFTCPGDPADPCGVSGGANWYSAGWPSAEIAQARGKQHIAAHVHKTPMQDQGEFEIEHGVREAVTPAASDLSVYLDTPKEG